MDVKDAVLQINRDVTGNQREMKAQHNALLSINERSSADSLSGKGVGTLKINTSIKYTNPARGIIDFCKQKLWPLPCSPLTN